MTPRQQQCYDMRATGMPVKVIAKELGVSPHTVKQLLWEARTSLRSQGKLPPPPERLSDGDFAVTQQQILQMLDSSAMGLQQICAAVQKLNEKQIVRRLYLLAKMGSLMSHGRGRSSVWMTPAYFASGYRSKAAEKALERQQAAAARQKLAEDEAIRKRQKVRKQMEAKALQAQTVNIVQSRPGMAGVTIQAAKGGEAIITERTLITVIPTPPGRFEVDIPRGKGAISSDWKARRLSEVQA
jgi:predicted transcriptional regulator